MKTQVSLALLICFLYHISAAPYATSMQRDGCCHGFNRTRIPKPMVAHVGMTSSSCQNKSIIITTVCKKKFCIDPDWIWAQRLLKDFQKAPFKPSVTKCPVKG
ncbi:C-C motif chemokine 24-like [Anoplopoma fimbria]|uniref:C-C motif chemokine 24-like n=1 Tax=Anoplopoma fimbria TaxID=229290 RepID=UPI0023ECB9CC|nr:C-C motif chemokine 24-like [Anoplopoma fimbria]